MTIFETEHNKIYLIETDDSSIKYAIVQIFIDIKNKRIINFLFTKEKLQDPWSNFLEPVCFVIAPNQIDIVDKITAITEFTIDEINSMVMVDMI